MRLALLASLLLAALAANARAASQVCSSERHAAIAFLLQKEPIQCFCLAWQRSGVDLLFLFSSSGIEIYVL